jgi:hypothetical protein
VGDLRYSTLSSSGLPQFCRESRSYIWLFLADEEILDQREVRDRVGGAIDLGGVRTAMRKFRGYSCVQFTALVLGSRAIFEAVMGQDCGLIGWNGKVFYRRCER